MNRIRQFLSSVAELISRFPMSKDEDRLLEELGAVYDGNRATDESAIGDDP